MMKKSVWIVKFGKRIVQPIFFFFFGQLSLIRKYSVFLYWKIYIIVKSYFQQDDTTTHTSHMVYCTLGQRICGNDFHDFR